MFALHFSPPKLKKNILWCCHLKGELFGKNKRVLTPILIFISGAGEGELIQLGAGIELESRQEISFLRDWVSHSEFKSEYM